MLNKFEQYTKATKQDWGLPGGEVGSGGGGKLGESGFQLPNKSEFEQRKQISAAQNNRLEDRFNFYFKL